MSVESGRDARQTLIAFYEASATADDVMRAIAAHDEWYVPALLGADLLPDPVMGETIVFSQDFDAAPGELWVFTDHESAMRAEGQAIGAYVGGVAGTKLLAALSGKFSALRVNPASPKNERWSMESDAFGMGELWARAIELERGVRALEPSPELYRLLAQFPGFMILIATPGRAAVLWDKFGDREGRFAAAFTAPDRVEGYLSRLTPEERKVVGTAALGGVALFNHMAELGVDAVLLNMDDPLAAAMVPSTLYPDIIAAGD